ncbi:3-hydroxybutyrate oligomer hydrolase family protein, partial [Burkholderia contaminans]
YATLANLLEPCAAASASLADAPSLSALPAATTQSIRTQRCATLAA